MADLEVTNVWAYPQEHIAYLRDALTYRPKGYMFRKDYKRGFWDGKECLLEREAEDAYRFPAGLVPFVQRYLVGKQIQPFHVVDLRIPPHIAPWGKPQRELDETQLEAVTSAIEAVRGVVHYPTGSGKTTIAGDFLRRLGLPSLVLCNAVDLMTQLQEELALVIGRPVGILGGGKDRRDDITVATVQTVKSPEFTDWLNTIQCVLVDEGHHLAAETYAQVMRRLENAYYRLAVSATPHRSSNAKGEADRETYLKVSGWTGVVVATQTKEEAVETGRLVPADIFIVQYGHNQDQRDEVDADYNKVDKYGQPWAYSRFNPNRRNYVQDMDEYLIRDPVRNQTITDIAMGMARRKQQIVVLVEREEHGKALQEMIGCPFVYGKTKQAERDILFNAFRSGLKQCLIVSKIGDEGLDLPNIDTLVLAGAGKAAHRQIQRIGRGLRKVSGKSHLNVFEFADKGKYLGAQYRRRRRSYELEPIFTVVDVTNEELTEWLNPAE